MLELGDGQFLFKDKGVLLTTIALSRRSYEKDRMISSYGRTEDIPVGSLLQMTYGKELDNAPHSHYLGMGYAKGQYYGKTGYFQFNFSAGGFIHDHMIREGVVKTNLSCFSYLMYFKNWSMRQFIQLNYVHGIRVMANEYLGWNDESGIRGLKPPLIPAKQRVNLQTESVVYTNLYLLGFRTAFFAFADFGFLGTDKSFFYKDNFYHGYGLGLRLKNDNIATSIFQIRLAFYPHAPGQSQFKFQASEKPSWNLRDFDLKATQIIAFE